MDITEAGAYYEVQGRPTGSGTDHGVTFTVPGSGLRTFLAFTEQCPENRGRRLSQPALDLASRVRGPTW